MINKSLVYPQFILNRVKRAIIYKEVEGMTIKKRLFWSNIYMILVPVAAAAMVGLVCLLFMWLALTHGIGFGIQDQEEFDLVCEAISRELDMESQDITVNDNIRRILDSNHMTMQIYEGDKLLYSYGAGNALDEKLRQSLAVLPRFSEP